MGTAVADLTLGAVLGNLTDQLNQIINAAEQAGRSLIIQAGTEVNIAIENAKNAFADLLDKAFADINATVRSTVDQLQSMLSQISDNAFSQLGSLTDTVQQIVNSLPFRKHQPQVTSTSPDFVVPTVTGYPISIRFKGNFELAATAGYEPVLQIGNQQFKPDAVTTQSLEFIVSVTSLFPALVPTAGFSFTRVQLTLPWRESGFLGVGHHDHRDSYSMVIGALPPSPGQLFLSYSITSQVTSPPRTFTSSAFYQSSASDAGNNDNIDVPYAVSAETGWHVIRNTSQFHYWGQEGNYPADWSYSFVSDDGDRVVYKVTTIHHKAGFSGLLHFNISFQENQPQTIVQNYGEQITLKWGDTFVIPYPVGTWKLTFTSFDGRHVEFAGSNTSDPFIKITDQGGQNVIGTADPKTLQWP
jgi:hypothetical protein